MIITATDLFEIETDSLYISGSVTLDISAERTDYGVAGSPEWTEYESKQESDLSFDAILLYDNEGGESDMTDNPAYIAKAKDLFEERFDSMYDDEKLETLASENY